MILHLVDGTFELFRAHFVKRPGHRAPGGQEVKATVGLCESLLALLHDRAEAPTHLAVAFDNPIRSFRNALFAGYKTEEGVEPELLAQLDLAEEAARSLGLTVWSMKDHEADDALCTAAARFASEVEQVRILSPDKDLSQCLRGARVVQVDRVRGKVTDQAALLERRGVEPESVPDLLALVGDDADGIPGLPGFGERTAAALLAGGRRLEAIPRSAADWPSGIRGAERLAETLRERWDEALLYRRLATLSTDVALQETLADLRFRGVPRDGLRTLCQRLGAERVLAAAERREGMRWES